MKLYIYDHCPFCVRARMMAGLRQSSVENVVLLNDDEATPIGLIGAKQVPILQKDDGTHMGESLDIVNYLNELSGNPPLQAARDVIQTWFSKVGEYYNRLIMPRDIQLNLPEFATPESIAYFIEKKEKNIGSFAENMANTSQYLTQINADLQTLSSAVLSDTALNGELVSLDDIILFPVLRNLTMVKGVIFPDNILKYLNKMSEMSGVDLYFNRAI